jgi:hypothetical protein
MSTNKVNKGPLLGANALKGLRLGISVSNSPDLQRLGLLETHFRLALGELARAVLVSGGQLTYGGHLDAGGYTTFLAHELHRFSRRDRPFHSILAWHEHRKLTTKDLLSQIADLGLYGDMIGLDPEGNVIDLIKNRPDEAIPETNQSVINASLTSLRRFLTTQSEGRIFIGGKRAGFQGDLPGIIEEAIFALDAKQPIYLAGGFGGATADIVRLFEVDGKAWIPKYDDKTDADPRWTKGIEALDSAWKKNGGNSLENGLTKEENLILAVSHRPSEVAALVSLGMGRKFTPDQKL